MLTEPEDGKWMMFDERNQCEIFHADLSTVILVKADNTDIRRRIKLSVISNDY